MNAPPEPMPAPAWQPPPPPPPANLAAVSRKVLLTAALGLLVVAVAVAFYSANAIVSVWFQHQWVPVARLVLSVLVAAGAFAAVRSLLARKAM